MRIKELAATRVRYGYRRIHVLLRREGWQINHKKTRRIYRELGLQLGTVRNSVCERAVEHYAAMALMKRSPNITANWAFAMVHSRGGIFHSFSDRFKIR